MTDLTVHFRDGLVPAHPLMMSALGLGRSAAYELLREFDLEFKRQRGVSLRRASKSNAVLIDRIRFELLRTVKRDVEDGKFPSCRHAVRYHLDPGRLLGVRTETLSLQLVDLQTRVSSWSEALPDSVALTADDRAMLGN